MISSDTNKNHGLFARISATSFECFSTPRLGKQWKNWNLCLESKNRISSILCAVKKRQYYIERRLRFYCRIASLPSTFSVIPAHLKFVQVFEICKAAFPGFWLQKYGINHHLIYLSGIFRELHIKQKNKIQWPFSVTSRQQKSPKCIRRDFKEKAYKCRKK